VNNFIIFCATLAFVANNVLEIKDVDLLAIFAFPLVTLLKFILLRLFLKRLLGKRLFFRPIY
jgi:hypothetical protein